MTQTMSVTEARDNFPALVRRVAEKDEAVVVTSHNQPKIVLMRWETYQAQQHAQIEAARYRLATCATKMEQFACGLLEGYRPDSYDLKHGTKHLLCLAQEAWDISLVLDRPRCYLASLLTDMLINVEERGAQLTQEQLERLIAAIPLLRQDDLTTEAVSKTNRSLLEVSLSAIFPMDDASATQYFELIEEMA